MGLTALGVNVIFYKISCLPVFTYNCELWFDLSSNTDIKYAEILFSKHVNDVDLLVKNSAKSCVQHILADSNHFLREYFSMSPRGKIYQSLNWKTSKF